MPGKLGDRAQSRQHSGVIARLGLHLDRRELSRAAEKEIHLGAVRGMRRPVVEVIEQLALLSVSPEQVQDPALEERTPLLRRNRSAEPLDRTDQARIDPVQLRMAALAQPHQLDEQRERAARVRVGRSRRRSRARQAQVPTQSAVRGFFGVVHIRAPFHATPGAVPLPGMPGRVGRWRIAAPVSLSAWTRSY